jgi:hypothetical protein
VWSYVGDERRGVKRGGLMLPLLGLMVMLGDISESGVGGLLEVLPLHDVQIS